jgi:hypothetical protein
VNPHAESGGREQERGEEAGGGGDESEAAEHVSSFLEGNGCGGRQVF